MNWSIKNEINHTYLIRDIEYDTLVSDYRFRMLKENPIEGTIVTEIRNINGEYKLYADITDRESLLHYISNHIIEGKDLDTLLEDMVVLSEKLEKLLCGEECIVVDPELIYINRLTGKHEFICTVPDDESDNDFCHVLEAFMDYLKLSDNNSCEALFEIYDLSISGIKGYKTLYEKLVQIKYPKEDIPIIDTKEEIETEEVSNVNPLESNHLYIPSVKEAVAAVLALAGTVLICSYIYGLWL